MAAARRMRRRGGVTLRLRRPSDPGGLPRLHRLPPLLLYHHRLLALLGLVGLNRLLRLHWLPARIRA